MNMSLLIEDSHTFPPQLRWEKLESELRVESTNHKQGVIMNWVRADWETQTLAINRRQCWSSLVPVSLVVAL